MEPKAIVLSGYGINADEELAEALRLAGAKPEMLHVGDLVADPERLMDARILAFPGGFSFGDHLGSGQVLALLCRRTLRPALERFIADGGFAIGVCNGFQALVRIGMLPNRDGRWGREVSLIQNASGRFVDGWYPVEFEAASRCLWTQGTRGPPPAGSARRRPIRRARRGDPRGARGRRPRRGPVSRRRAERLGAGNRRHLRSVRPRVRPNAAS